MGLIGCIFPAVRRPGTLTLLAPEDFLARPSLWLRTLSRTRATCSPAPNFAYGLCLDRIRDDQMEGCDLSNWRLALNGAEPVSPAILQRFVERFGQWGLRSEALTPVYGLSEAALAVTFAPVDRPFLTRSFETVALRKGTAILASDAPHDGPREDGPASPRTSELASVGLPLRGFRVEIRDEHDGVLPNGCIGTIWAQGPSLMDGYLSDAPSPIRDGWLDTGDLGFLLDGELFITGRAKDLIILRGQNHNPSEIEYAIDTVEGVRTGCSAAVGHLRDGVEHLVVFVETREPDEELAQACERAVLRHTGLRPDQVVLLPAGTLPRTSSGKIRRREALQRWDANQLTPPGAVNAWTLSGALARSAMGYLRGPRQP
jgi:acyl-CoA synthetase (AMP-forming)/AMP-acid ligase II